MPDKKKPQAKRKSELDEETFDAHQFNVMHDAAYQLPRTARGGARDLSGDLDPKSEGPTESAGLGEAPPSFEQSVKGAATPGKYKTLAEMQESRRYVEGEQKGPKWDTVYQEPESVRFPAQKEGMRVRHGSDVHFKEPEMVQPASIQEPLPPPIDPRKMHIDALLGPPSEAPAIPRKEDERVRMHNGYKFLV